MACAMRAASSDMASEVPRPDGTKSEVKKPANPHIYLFNFYWEQFNFYRKQWVSANRVRRCDDSLSNVPCSDFSTKHDIRLITSPLAVSVDATGKPAR
jgi:hypothetical protein